MNDEIDILIAGNVRGHVRLEQRLSEAVASAQVCATTAIISDGRTVSQTICLSVELHGPHAYTFAQHHHTGSRVVLRGHLAKRTVTRTEQLARADGPGTVAVRVERHEYVVVIDRVLHSDGGHIASHPQDAAPPCPTPGKAVLQGVPPQGPGASEREWSF